MKQLFYLAMTFLFVLSCAPTKTELWINKNGSGKIKTEIDLSEMYAMAGKMIESELGEEDKKASEAGKIDTTFNFYDAAPDSIKALYKHSEIMKKFVVDVSVDSEKEEGVLRMIIDYDSADEKKLMFENFNKFIEAKTRGTSKEVEKLNSIFVRYKTDYKNGVVRVQRNDFMKPFEEEMENDAEFKILMESLKYMKEGDEKLEMIKQMFGDQVKTIIYCPGEVEFTNDINAIIDGSKVIFVDDIVKTLIEGKPVETGDRIIKYKK